MGQRFDATGAPVGAELQFSTPSYPGNKENPAVDSDLGGNFVVVWEHARDDNAYPGSPEEIVGRRYDDQGALDPSEFVVNEPSPFRHENPSLARAGNSNFVVVWQREYPEGNSGGTPARNPGIFAQRFDPDGARLGEQFLVTTYHGENSADNITPDVSSDLGGNFVVVWEYSAAPADVEDGQGIGGRRFDAFGNPLDATEFVVNSYTTGPQGDPAVSVGSDGTFIVVWEGEGPGEPINSGIFARKFHSTGGALVGDFLVNSSTSGFQLAPDVVVADADGHFMVTWKSRPIPSPPDDVMARWFRNDGVPFEPEFQVPTVTANSQYAPTVVGDVSGDFVVVWAHDDNDANPPDPGFFARRFEQPVLLSINDLAIAEGDAAAPGGGVAVLTVEASRSHPTLDVTAEYATEDDLASSFDDYVSSTGEVMFEAGTSELAAPISIAITGDDVFEADETFLIHLSGAVNAAIIRDQGIGVILNDDDPPEMTITDVAIEEGNAGTSILAFRVDLAELEQEDATVDFATTDGTATAGSDYQAASGTLTIPGGSMSGFVGVEINGDFMSEPDETITITLSNPTNAVLIDDTATGTILDDDCAVAVTIDPPNANFPVGGGPGSITVSDPQGCGWSAESNAVWLQITSSASGTGNATVDYMVEANADPLPRNGTITVLNQSHVVTQDGVSCTLGLMPNSADFPSAGGNDSFDVSDPSDCGWTAVSNAPWIIVTSGSSGTGDGQVEYQVDAKTNPGDRTGTILVSGLLFTANQQGSFFDHFDDSVLSASWVYSNPQFWSESGSFLRADVLGMSEEAQAIAAPAFGGCTECTISARLRADVFAVGDITLFGWYVDPANYLSLTMNEFANEWTLRQVVGGVDVQSVMTDTESIFANTLYDIELSFDGDEIVAKVDDAPLLFLTPWQGTPPQGTVGFHAAGTQAAFDLITVLTVTEAASPELVFADGFDSGDLSSWSGQTP
ncbi:MAG: Calx-beta domain-containing protein [Acidobacteriota bacterium]